MNKDSTPPHIPEHLRGCPFNRGEAGCIPMCVGSWPGEVCGAVIIKHGLDFPLHSTPPRSGTYRGRNPAPEE